MLDNLSGGRLEIGVGRGVLPWEVAAFGVDPAEAQAMYMEAFQVILGGRRDGRVDHAGKHYTYRDVPLPFAPLQRPHPPLWYGVASPDGAGWPAQNAVNVISNAPCPVARSATDQYRVVWSATHGGAPLPRPGIARHLYIGAPIPKLKRAPHTPGVPGTTASAGCGSGTAPAPASTPTTSPPRAATVLIAGAPNTVAAEIARQVEAAGVNYFVCRFAFGDLGFAKSAHSLARFVGQVSPRSLPYPPRGAERVSELRPAPAVPWRGSVRGVRGAACRHPCRAAPRARRPAPLRGVGRRPRGRDGRRPAAPRRSCR